MPLNSPCLLLFAGSYLFGSISFAILVTKLWTGEDIREIGNKNAGTANVARTIGLLPGIIVGVMDFAKGALPVTIVRILNFGDARVLIGVITAVL